MKTFEVDLDMVEQNENSRVNYQAGDMSELMGSMKAYGLLEPIGLRKQPGRPKYEVVFGNRRFISAQKLGWASISAHVVEAETDVDRDILNLIENFKRQSTTLAEDGRMFHSLIDRGLTSSEVAAKLGISMPRVQAALESYSQLPKDYHKKIVSNHKGNQKAGLIAATMAIKILNMKKSLALSDDATRKLLDFSSNDNTSVRHLGLVAPLLKQGYEIEEALQVADHYKDVRFRFLMDKTNVRQLEKKYKQSISDIILDILYEHKELKIARRTASGRRGRVQAAETVA